jgi:vacuolar protein sorting-associated protein 13A/C
VRRCFAYLTTSLWSYHQSLEVWEPILEPWQLLLHMDTNPNPAASAGIAPGTWIKVTSPHGCMHVTLAQAALNYALDALADWQDLAAGGDASSAAAKRRQGLAATDGLTVYTTVLNTLDTAAYIQLDYGEGRKEVVTLPPHTTTPLTQPVPVPAASHAPLTDGQPPPMRLVVDVLDGQLLAGLGGASWAPELFVQVGLRHLRVLAMPARVHVQHALAGARPTEQAALMSGTSNVAMLQCWGFRHLLGGC